ncbi:hypothetical protein EE612_008837 [Oryza sativa]|nr:hypothetical protein EE612_008837 [Oryza sativa]
MAPPPRPHPRSAGSGPGRVLHQAYFLVPLLCLVSCFHG